MIAAFFVACSRVSWSRQIDIVSPSAADGVEGDRVINAGGDARFQFLFPAADFMSLPESHRTITKLAWRPDLSNTFTGLISAPARFSLSTTSADALDLVFANNVGEDETLVFDGPIMLQTDDTGPAPREFDFVFPFVQPFHYDPNLGHLLVDFTALEDWDNVSLHIDAENVDAALQAVGSSNPSASTGSSFGRIFVTQFTFVPEPSSLLLGLLGTTAVIFGPAQRQISRHNSSTNCSSSMSY